MKKQRNNCNSASCTRLHSTPRNQPHSSLISKPDKELDLYTSTRVALCIGEVMILVIQLCICRICP